MARCVRGLEMALRRDLAVSALIAGSWTWKRLCAHAAGHSRRRGLKADYDVSAAAGEV